MKRFVLFPLFLAAVAVLFYSCVYDDEIKPHDIRVGEVADVTVSNITQNSATVSSVVTDWGNANSVTRGFCYSTSPQPDENSHKIEVGGNTVSFHIDLQGLEPGVTYYVRAYIDCDTYIGYSENDREFTTNLLGGGVVTTGEVSNIKDTSATVGGEVTSVGDPEATEAGICYSTSEQPTVSDSKVAAQSAGLGEFSVDLENLTSGTTYYARAYIANANGTVYGEQASFKTETPHAGTVTTGAVSNITSTAATVAGEITDAGYPAATEAGICYSTSGNPTVDDGKVSASSAAAGSFSVSLAGLAENTKYYARAYIINSQGVGYGAVESFETTPAPRLGAVEVLMASGITDGSAVIFCNITDVGSPAVTESGVCYSTSANPTTANAKASGSSFVEGNFTSELTGLQSGTKYYIRAYVINSHGTAYSTQDSFETH